MAFPGYMGRVVYVDLSRGRAEEKPLEGGLVERFLGGYGINNWLAYEGIPPDADPLSPENALVLGAGPFFGTTIPGSAKFLVTTRFPINGAFATASGGGSFALRFKTCGYDHAVITGKAASPVYLVFSAQGVEMRDASDLWGRDNYETVDILRGRHEPCSVVPIGPAGENQVALSITSVDKAGTLGRGGLAAVMGAKNLKALVAVEGDCPVTVAQRLRFQQAVDALIQRIMRWPGRARLMEQGLLEEGFTVATPHPLEPLPPGMEAAHIRLRRRLACPSCPLGEKSRVCLEDGPFAGTVAYMPHFWMESFGGEGREAHDRAIEYSATLNRLGLCHMNFSYAFLLLTRLYQQGIIGKQETRGLELRPDLETALTLARLTAHREGLGEVLAEGLVPAARRLGIEKHLDQVKGQALVYDARLKGLGTMEFSQVINPRGSHVAAGGSPAYEPNRPLADFQRHGERMGATPEAISRAVRENYFNPGRYTKFSDDWFALFNCLGLCNRAFVNRFYHINSITELYQALTGREVSPREMMAAAARSWDLGKVLNARAGFSRQDDRPPPSWFEPVVRRGKELRFQDYFQTRDISPEDFDRFLDDYYQERGYDPATGVPGLRRLQELGIAEFRVKGSR